MSTVPSKGLLSPSDIAEIESLVAEHSWLIDHRQADLVHLLYAEDGVLEAGDLKLSGTGEIARWGAERVLSPRRTMHKHATPRLRREAASAAHAEGWVNIVVYEPMAR